MANWVWFLQNISNVLVGERPLTFVSDRNAGLLEVMPTIFPDAHHTFCLQHLQRNLKDKMQYMNSVHRDGLVTKFRACA
ncbi:hypothetical protein ACSBR1_014956 [Camellia fascicularis]